MQAWEESKSGTTVETNVAVDENNFVRSQTANRRVTRYIARRPRVPVRGDPGVEGVDAGRGDHRRPPAG